MLVMVGDGPDRVDAEAEARELGVQDKVFFLGKIDAVAPLLAGADLFLLPSSSESFGLSALEALASGVPVIGSDAGGLPEVVRDGETGFLCPVGDVDGDGRGRRRDSARRRALARDEHPRRGRRARAVLARRDRRRVRGVLSSTRSTQPSTHRALAGIRPSHAPIRERAPRAHPRPRPRPRRVSADLAARRISPRAMARRTGTDPGLAFDVALHVGTLVAVLWYFRAEWIALIARGVQHRRTRRVETAEERRVDLPHRRDDSRRDRRAAAREVRRIRVRDPLLIGDRADRDGVVLWLVDKRATQRSAARRRSRWTRRAADRPLPGDRAHSGRVALRRRRSRRARARLRPRRARPCSVFS